jgi:hypothetical protein
MCNRLRGLSGAVAVAQLVNKPLYLVWAEGDTSEKFSDVLISDDFTEVNSYEQVPGDLWDFGIAIDTGNKSSEFYQFARDLVTPVEFEQRYIDVRRSWTPSKAVEDKVDALLYGHDGHNAFASVAGVHVRRTDFAPHRERRPESHFSNAQLIKCFELELHKGVDQLFLATDDQGTRDVLLKRFGDKLIVSDATHNEYAFRQTSQVDAMVDIQLLSHCKWIIGVMGSSFGEYAATLTGVPFYHLDGWYMANPRDKAERLLWIMGKITQSTHQTIQITNALVNSQGLNVDEIAKHMTEEEYNLYIEFIGMINGLVQFGVTHYGGVDARPAFLHPPEDGWQPESDSI